MGVGKNFSEVGAGGSTLSYFSGTEPFERVIYQCCWIYGGVLWKCKWHLQKLYKGNSEHDNACD